MNRMIAQFSVDGAGMAAPAAHPPVAASASEHRPIASAARALGNRLASAVGTGRQPTASNAVAKDWKEF